MEKILNFEQPLDVHLLDTVVHTFYTSTNAAERKNVETLLTQFQEHPDAWLSVKDILEASQKTETKFIALQVLDKCIKYRWKILPAEQREGIKNFIIALILKLSSTEASLQQERVQLQKLNATIVSVLKQEWPRNWGGFVTEICTASRSSESVCENNLNILKLLCEEVFDFSLGEMTQAKIKELKGQFFNEFSQIYQLCEFVLQNSQNVRLLTTTLKAMLRFLTWIPDEFIFGTEMMSWLVYKFFPVPQFRNDALACLTEVANLKDQERKYTGNMVHMFTQVMNQLANVLRPETNIADAYENGTSDDEDFIQQLSLFISAFLKHHLQLVETPEHQGPLMQALHYLVGISHVEELEVFKICLEYWGVLAADLYNTECQFRMPTVLSLGGMGDAQQSARRQLYHPILSKVRVVLIDRMPRPEEVLIKEDEAGEIVRETMKDTDAIILYKSMRETLIFLTHLNYEDTESIMQDKLDAQVNGNKFSWNSLNTLCWAIGSISGAMSEDGEKRFLVTVIKELLSLCEQKRGKDNKAVVASNIMYVVGQYPRFLRAHWKFLKTVVNKLFEFMHETHPGVQDMACETFLKISQKCRRKFVTTQAGEQQPFIEELLANLGNIINDLESHQVHIFYEAVGYMISAHCDQATKRMLIDKLMELPNQKWAEFIGMAAQNAEFLKNNDTIKMFGTLLTTNRMCATSAGPSYVFQLGHIYLDMLHVYKAYSEMVSMRVSSAGAHVTKHFDVGIMRKVKKETLRLIETYVENSDDPVYVVQNFLPPLLDPVLGDYARGVPDARDSEVLSLMTILVSKLGQHMQGEVFKIFEALFATTLNMITSNFHDYPDIRLNFFKLLQAINSHCFLAYFTPEMQPHFKLVMDSVCWAYKHTERTIAEIGLQIQLDMLQHIAETEFADAFFKQFYIAILNDILYVLTDTFHKPGLKLQSSILMLLFNAVETNVVRVQLWDPQQKPHITDNVMFVKDHISTLLNSQFPNLTQLQIKNIVEGMFTYKSNPVEFKNHLRDFLVQLKEFSDGDNADLYEEERAQQIALDKDNEMRRRQAVPGLIAPHEVKESGMADD